MSRPAGKYSPSVIISAEKNCHGGHILWSQCTDCGKLRKVTLRSGVPCTHLCHSCAAKQYAKEHPFVLPNRRVCKVCRIDKSIEDFKKSGSLREHRCKSCYNLVRDDYKKSRARNKEIYGTAHTPEQLERVRIARSLVGDNNMRTTGRRTSLRWLATLSDRGREVRRQSRLEAVSLYGGKCACCGDSNSLVLTFDHINGGGTRERREKKMVANASFYRSLVGMGYPNGKYRLLCWNCNSSFGRYGYCPHNVTPNKELNYHQRHNRKLKMGVVDAYGGKCQLCGETHWEFLTIDHVNGGGRSHYRVLRSAGLDIYRVLRDSGYPREEYRLLCSNCNCGRRGVGVQGIGL